MREEGGLSPVVTGVAGNLYEVEHDARTTSWVHQPRAERPG